MNSIHRQIVISLISTGFMLISTISSAKQSEIGIAAVATDVRLIGKGEFVVNDTLDEGDSLKTGEKGYTTILFNDESMLTLGPNAEANIEVYEEPKDGKPGRSIIRIIKGQFRYFPGGILESGGSQFVAVGNKLLGKSASVRDQQRRADHNPATGSTGRAGQSTNNHKRTHSKKNIPASGVNSSSPVNNTNGTTPDEHNNHATSDSGTMATNANESNSTGENDTDAGAGGAITGMVTASAEGASMTPSNSDSTSNNAGSDSETGTDTPAAPDDTIPTTTASTESSDSSNSDSNSDDSSSSSTTTRASSTTTTDGSVNSDLDSSPAPTGVRNTGPIVVATGGSTGAGGTGGTGGSNQDCGPDGCSGGNGNLPGGIPGLGIGSNPGETGGIGGGTPGGSDGSSPVLPGGGTLGGSSPVLPGSGNTTPDVYSGTGISGKPAGNGRINDFADNGIFGNVVGGAGNFRGSVDVFGNDDGKTGFLGTISADRDIGLNLQNQPQLTGKLSAVTNETFSTTTTTDLAPTVGSKLNTRLSGNIGNLGNLNTLGNIGNVKEISNIGNVGNIGNVKEISNIGNVGNIGNVKEISNIGDVGRIDRVRNISNIGGTGGLIGGTGGLRSIK